MKPSERKNITQPPDWWHAFEAAAKDRGVSLSEFAGVAMRKLLPFDERRKLSQRPSVGAPKKNS